MRSKQCSNSWHLQEWLANLEVHMAHRSLATILIFVTTMFLAMPANAQQNPKPFTQDQVQGMVRDGLGDDTGAKAIEQRGVDFAATEDFIQSLKAAGASEVFLAASGSL